MLEYCIRVYETYLGNKRIGYTKGVSIIPQEQIHEMIVEQITWYNVLKIKEKYGLVSSFGVKETKKGLVIYPDNTFRAIKQWKTKYVDMCIKVHYKQRQASINDILQYYDNEKAIQYLIERGMSVVR